MIREAIAALVDERRDLTEHEARESMREIMNAGLDASTGEQATAAQFGAFVTALRLKGETVDELLGMAKAMREASLHVDVSVKPLLDTCGTGGSNIKVFNASTAAAFVAAGAGAKVAKHGNRAMTSQSGSADLLEALGAVVTLGPTQVAECINKTGVGFMFAQTFHPAMKFAGPLRREIGVRTVFNILGPLTNPAGATCHVMGAPNVELAEKLAHVLSHLGMRHALVVTGDDGLDDITVTGPTQAFEVRGIEVTRRTITPFDLGLTIHPAEALTGGDAEQNAALTRSVLTGNGPLALRDLVVAQAAAGLYVTGLAASLRQGAEMAIRSIDDGDAAAKLAAFVEATRRAAGK
ncbi:MAG: anthranilate phosphoribosyltransferase [Chloroflexi bacterium]|nr:anthranilate phosphoribosyltransferase [Chloroflexota bacterium]MQC25785.1 anthranilate phosphoribosyltransferase [Chloroflexota bacterium]MQC47687.1 anthranilate phosphoribosyltransferase [Chloroflexota bacterium]